jgi:hypothetical protein
LSSRPAHPVEPAQELREIAQRLEIAEASFDDPRLRNSFDAIDSAATEAGTAWCRSWLGFESRIYYAGLATPPPGTYFRTGFSPLNSMMNSSGSWVEHGLGVIEKEIYKRAGNQNLDGARRL